MISINQRVFTIFLVTVIAVFSANVALAQNAVVDAINESETPSGGTWSAYSYGIDYTPTSSYQVTRIEANWNGLQISQTITVEVFDANPNSGGVKLTEGSFTQTAAGWQGADLNSPVEFTAGEDYFIGFGNSTGSMGRIDGGGTGADRYTVWWGNGVGTYEVEDNNTSYNDPIFRFLGTSRIATAPVPDSSTLSLLMLIALLVGTAAYTIRRIA